MVPSPAEGSVGAPPTITISASAGDPVVFAANELQHYLSRITGAAVTIARGNGRANLLRLGEAGACEEAVTIGTDAFAVTPTGDGAVIVGESARAVLHGVYALLEQLGCRWSLQHRREEVVPRLGSLPPVRPIRAAPRFAVRGYSADIMTWHYGNAEHLAEHLAADYEFIDWMGKTGANAYFFIRHPFDMQLTIPELLPEFARRGIAAEYGGHVIPQLLPRELFRDHPEYFPQSTAGERREFGNLCTSNLAALRLATANAIAYVREHPELSVLHIWGADLWDGGWCRCSACASVSVQDQSLRLCNAVARALAEAGVPRPVCYLAYHDTIEADVHERPGDQVMVEFAPRERCFAHALNDPACETNPRYRDALERYVELFDGRVRIFEYYADAILFCGCAVPLGDVIAADLDYFHALGIREITCLQFGAFSVWAYPVNFATYAVTTRLPGCNVAALRDASATRFGPAAGAVATTLAQLEAIMREVVTYGDIRRPPKNSARRLQLAPRLVTAAERCAALAGALAPYEGSDDARALQALLRYNAALLQGVAGEAGGRRDAALYEPALAIMHAVDRRFSGLWGAETLPAIHGYYDASLRA
jgi:hypothetical protein